MRNYKGTMVVCKGSLTLQIYILLFWGVKELILFIKQLKKCIKEDQNLGSEDEGVKHKSKVDQYQGSRYSSTLLAGLYLYPMYSTHRLGAPWFQPYPFTHFLISVLIWGHGTTRRNTKGMGRCNASASRLVCQFSDYIQHLVNDCELMKAAWRK